MAGMSAERRVHTFTDDALGEDDAVGVAERIKAGEVSRGEVEAAAVERLKRAHERLNAVRFEAYDAPRRSSNPDSPLDGVPTLIKDNHDVGGWPTNHGSETWTATPAAKDGAYVRQYLGSGMTALGKTTMPEFGLNATTEFRAGAPTVNPWDTAYSVGASSGGAAALVASGAVPIAHANDGGGSIRIPAAAAGLVGLKPSRGRHRDGEEARMLPINIISEGVLTRSVRDTAAFVYAMERQWRNPKLAPIGQVSGPADRRLRIGLLLESVNDTVVDPETRDACELTAKLLEAQGHIVEPIAPPVDPSFEEDFVVYWGFLAAAAVGTGKLTFDKTFDRTRLDGFTDGLRRSCIQGGWKRVPGALHRLRKAGARYAEAFRDHELIIAPVVANTTPLLGHLGPNQPFDQLLDKLRHHAAFTPIQNVTGTPAISLPMAVSSSGMPIGVQLAAAYGDERTLLEVAYALEAQAGWPRIQSVG